VGHRTFCGFDGGPALAAGALKEEDRNIMSFLDAFALFVLAVLAIAAIVVIGALGALPGRVARSRQHPQADAIAVGGWLGLLFFGVLWPLVMIWAYTQPGRRPEEIHATRKDGDGGT